MFSEILKIIPKLDNSSLNQMEKSLASRFSKVAKKFGSGLKSALLGGGIAAATLGIINKILNPLEEVQNAINKTLHQADDLDTFAKQFHTTSGKLMNLEAMAGAKGLDAESLHLLMLKFQEKVTQARADGNAPSTVREFANMPDTGEAFFSFIQSLQNLTAAQRDYVQSDVFGAKQVGKASEFLNVEDFGKLAQSLHLINDSALTPVIENAANREDQQKVLEVRRNYNSFLGRAPKISEGMIADENLRELKQELHETNMLNGDAYKGLKMLQQTGDSINNSLEDGIKLLAQHLPDIVKFIGNIAGSRPARGVNKKEDH